MAMEDRMDRKFQEHSDQIHVLQNKVDFFVRTSLPPVEGIFFDGQTFDALSKPETGLFFQSPAYILDEYKNEKND